MISSVQRMARLPALILIGSLSMACTGIVEQTGLNPGDDQGDQPISSYLLGGQGVCEAMDVQSLKACVEQLRNPDGETHAIHIGAMIVCEGESACRINLDGLTGKTIYGAPDWSTGFLRRSHHRSYAIIDAALQSNPGEIEIRDLVFDEGAPVHDYSIWSQFSMPIRILDGVDIAIQHVLIRNFNERAIWANRVQGFTLEDSRIENGQHLGVVVGTADIGGGGYEPSNRVVIRNNSFYKAGLNALVLNGVRGAAHGDNRVENNVFDNSHFHGLYDGAAGIAGNIHGGGMIYLMDASYVTFSGNTIKNGFCDNCNLHPGAFGPRHEVRGFEIDGDIWHEPIPSTRSLRASIPL